MKFTSLSRFLVVGMTLVGTAVVALSHPGNARQAGAIKHLIIPASVQMSQVQEFKDAATIHLKDLQSKTGGGGLERGFPAKVVFDKTFTKDFFVEKIVWFPPDYAIVSTGGGKAPAQRLTPADVAILSYAFDEGIDMIRKNPASSASLTATPTMISGHISPKDMGMTYPQLRQMTAQYIDAHPMRYWNEARVGLASGK